MSYVSEWTPVAGIAGVWGFVVLLFTPYLAPLVLGIALLVAVVALMRFAVVALIALVAAQYRLLRRAYQILSEDREPEQAAAQAAEPQAVPVGGQLAAH